MNLKTTPDGHAMKPKAPRVPRVHGFHFQTDVTVRFAETDAQGVVHNSNYLVWFEIARVAYLETFAGGYNALRDQGIESFVLESHVRYLKPAHFDDRLRINARRAARRAFSFRLPDRPRERADRRWVDVARLRRREDAATDAHSHRAGRGNRRGGSYGVVVVVAVVVVVVFGSLPFGFGFAGAGFGFSPTRTISGSAR